MRALGAAAAVAMFAAAIHASRTLLAAYRERLRLEIESALQAQPPSEPPTPAVEGSVVGVPAVVHGTADEDDGSVPTRRELTVQVVTLGSQLAQVVELAQQEKARATAALTQLSELATEAAEAKEQAADWATRYADLSSSIGRPAAVAKLQKELEVARVVAEVQVARAAHANDQAMAKCSSLEAQVAALEEQLETAQRALEMMNRAQRGVDRLRLTVPPRPPGLVPTPGWSRCVAALEAVDAGYAKWAGREHKTLLISNYDDLQPAQTTVECKRSVNGAIGAHLRRLRPDLAAELRADESLILLLLEAPGCGTTRALVQALPGLRSTVRSICVPQADPTHYASMVHPTCDAMPNDPMANDPMPDPTPCATSLTDGATAGSAAGEDVGDAPAVRDGQSPTGNGGSPGDEIGLGLNVRCQRLDVWLCANAARGLKVACCFADFESSVYGRPKVGFAPLRDLQRFFRHRYADEAGCLLGVTLGFRDPHDSRYAAEAPRLGLADLQAFVACEAQAVGLRCTVLETVAYALTFCLFELVRDDAETMVGLARGR